MVMEVRNFIASEKYAIESGGADESESESDGEGLGALENPSYGPQSGGVSMDFGFPVTNAAEVLYSNSMDRIAFFQYGEEYFAAPDPLDVKRHSIVSVNDDSFSRTEYDGLYRMLERTVWKNGKSSSAISMQTRTRYTYADSSARLPKFYGEENFKDNTYREVRYNRTGKPLEIVDYDVGAASNGGAKRILRKKSSYTYDVKDRLVIDSQLENFTDGTSKSTKNIYSYTALSKLPDVSYYEDNVLRIQTSYRSDSDYTQTVYFDGGFSISAEYQGGERILEITRINGVVMSRRTFKEAESDEKK